MSNTKMRMFGGRHPTSQLFPEQQSPRRELPQVLPPQEKPKNIIITKLRSGIKKDSKPNDAEPQGWNPCLDII